MQLAKTKPSEILVPLISGLVMAGFGGWFALGAMGLYEIKGILVANWIAACAGLLFFLGGVAMLSQLFTGGSSRKPDNSTNEIRPVEGGAAIINTWFATVFVLLIVSMFWGVIFTGARGSGNMPMWMLIGMISLFTIIGVVLLGYAIWMTANALQFSNVKLRIKDYPPRTGGKLTAVLTLPKMDSVLSLDATLKCYILDLKSLIDSQDPMEIAKATMRAHWQKTKHILLNRSGITVNATIEIDIPAELPAANWFVYATNQTAISGVTTGKLTRWVLEIEKDIAGPDLKRSYEIPVHSSAEEEVAAEPTDEVVDDMSRERAVKLIAKSELQTGTSPEAIAAKLGGLGIPLLMINGALRGLMVAGECPDENSVLSYLEQQQRLNGRKKLKRVNRLKEVVKQTRSTEAGPVVNPMNEFEFQDIIGYGKYVLAFGPLICVLVYLVIMFF